MQTARFLMPVLTGVTLELALACGCTGAPPAAPSPQVLASPDRTVATPPMNAVPSAVAVAPPRATVGPPPGWTPPPPPKDDEIVWGSDAAQVLVVTDRVKADLEARPGYASTKIVLRRDATDAHLAQMASKLPWVSALVTDESTNITSLSPLRNLAQLRMLHLNSNRLKSLSGLAGHPALESITLSCSTDFGDVNLSALANMTTLRSIELRQCPTINDLKGVESVPGLTMLTSSGSPITRLDPIAGSTRLRSLLLRDSRVSDLAPLAKLTGLGVLELSGVQATSWAPLAPLAKLVSLTLENANIADIGVIAGAQDLYSLDLRNAKSLKLARLPALPKLSMLVLDGANVADLAPLARLPALEYVSFDQTAATRLAPLLGLRRLKSLTVPAATPDAELIAVQKAFPGISITRFGRLPPGVVPGPPIP